MYGTIAYESRSMTSAERRYPVHEQELLSVIHAFKTWKHLLQGAKRKFMITTDNTPTKHVMTVKELSPRQARWAEFLAEFNFDIDYAPGETNVVADALSRRPDLMFLGALSNLHAPDVFKHLVMEAGKHDAQYSETLQAVQAGSKDGFVLEDGLLYCLKGNKGVSRKRLYIPDSDALRTLLLAEAHDTETSGHLGRNKTFERLAASYYWPNMISTVHHYCKTCPACQRNKASSLKQPGLLQPLPIPERSWSSVSMDLIVSLPLTKAGNDAIVVFVDRFSKMAHIVPVKSTITAEELANVFFQEVFRLHGLPSSIVSDRDSKFTSKFWSSLFELAGTKLKLSTANHPQTDGQTERMNRTLEEMLRSFVGPFHNDWDKYLVACEFAYNSSKQASSGVSPFYVNYGFEPTVPLTVLSGTPVSSDNDSANQYLDRIHAATDAAKAQIAKAQARQAAFYDKSKRDLTFQVGDRVLLSVEHFAHMPSHVAAYGAVKKLNSKYYGPFRVKAIVSPVAYLLELPAVMKVHPVIHVSRLKLFHENLTRFSSRPAVPDPPAPFLDGNDMLYVVEAFVKHRGKGRDLAYLVKWLGYPEHENSWVRATGLRSDLGPAQFKKFVDAYNAEVNHRQKPAKLLSCCWSLL